MAIDDEQVLEPVEVHVQERRAPRPLARADAREHGDVGPGAVAAGELQHVPHPLLSFGGQADRLR